MTIFPVLIFLFVFALLLVSGFGVYRCMRRRQRVRAVLFVVPFAILALYFSHVVFGPFQRNPEKSFRYALGFTSPAGCSDIKAYEDEGFHPGVTIWLRFQASPEALTTILSQAHFTASTAQDFSDLQKRKATVNWWTPIPGVNFWRSSEFHGPYTFNEAGLAYDTNSGTAFVYVTGFD